MTATRAELLIPYRKVVVSLQLDRDEPVSHFLAATIRGGFGYTLRRTVCSMNTPECTGCILRGGCVYAWLFETMPPPDAPRLRLYESIPRPFVIRPVQTRKNIEIHLGLIGNAVQYLPYFVHTFNLLGKEGIGRKHLRFSVVSVKTIDGKTLYPVGNQQVITSVVPDQLSVFPGESRQGSVILNFKTPTIIRKNGRILASFNAQSFVSTALRRVTNLNAFFGMQQAQQINPAPYLTAAAGLHTVGALTMSELSRISTRQNKELDYSGLVGEIAVFGDIGTLLPLLTATEILGVGKNTAFGCGTFSIGKPILETGA